MKEVENINQTFSKLVSPNTIFFHKCTTFLTIDLPQSITQKLVEYLIEKIKVIVSLSFLFFDPFLFPSFFFYSIVITDSLFL